MGQIQSLEDLILFLRRNTVILAGSTALGGLASIYLALQQPHVYEAVAVLQVKSAIVAPEGGANAPASTAAESLQAIEQEVTTRENLTQVIERHGLFADMPGVSMDEKLYMIRQQLRFQGVESSGSGGFGQSRPLSAILVHAQADAPETAAAVANDFAQSLLDRSAEQQREKARSSVAFFAEEEKRLWEQLTELESEMADYKNANIDALPGLGDARREELGSLETDLRGAELEKRALQGQLDQIRAKADLRETDRRQAAELQAKIELIETQYAEAQRRRTEIEASLARAPEVERVLAGFDRERQQLRGQYDLVSSRMAEAETQLRLAERSEDERFSLLERAVTPENPIGGSRRKIVFAGTLVAGLLGLAAAFVLDLLRPVVRTARQMERQLGLVPVVRIPEISDLPPAQAQDQGDVLLSGPSGA